MAADLTDPRSVCALIEAAGAVDILVNNAALFPTGPTVPRDASVDGAAAELFDTVSFYVAFAANVRASYQLTAAFAPAMVAKGSGSIVNVSTMAARIGMPGLPVYGATKAALESLTRTWAAELSPSGVRVNTVAPGPTRTEMVLATMGEQGAAQVGATTLLGRLATAREIAEVILFWPPTARPTSPARPSRPPADAPPSDRRRPAEWDVRACFARDDDHGETARGRRLPLGDACCGRADPAAAGCGRIRRRDIRGRRCLRRRPRSGRAGCRSG